MHCNAKQKYKQNKPQLLNRDRDIFNRRQTHTHTYTALREEMLDLVALDFI